MDIETFPTTVITESKQIVSVDGRHEATGEYVGRRWIKSRQAWSGGTRVVYRREIKGVLGFPVAETR